MIKVLIVEDEEIIRNGFIHTFDWLAMDCCIVGAAADGHQGLAMIRTLHPDLVFADIMMPVMNGLEMLEAARENCSFKTIILTSYNQFEFAQQAIRLQVFDYLLKPVDGELLRNLLDRIKPEIIQEKVFHKVMEITRDKDDLELSGKTIYAGRDDVLNPYVASALARIRHDYAKHLVFEEVAEELGVSTSYLSRKFKEATRQTFHAMLNRYRIQKALELIRTGRCRIYEISERTGFSDYKHFCLVFKKYTGVPPTKFANAANCIICEKPDTGFSV